VTQIFPYALLLFRIFLYVFPVNLVLVFHITKLR
jgi:hypothetical protein